MSTRVEIQGLTCVYPRASRPAVHDVSLAARPGELLCLVGPSGCGKTTLLKAISGLIGVAAGRIELDGELVNTVPPEKRGAVMVFQSHLLFPFMSVLENVGFSLRMRGASREQWVPVARRMLERVRLERLEERRPAELSGGQQQRVALARALVAEPRVLLLDEPLANLDRHLREDMRQVILGLQRASSTTTICVTHDQEEAVLLGDRIAMLSAGELVQVGTAESFYERPASVQVARFFGNHNQLEGTRHGSSVICELGTLRICDSPAGGGDPPPETRAEPGDAGPWPGDGPACIHIRPEAIELLDPGSSGDNVLEGRVQHRVYVGTHVRYSVLVGGQPWQVVAPPHRRHYEEGARVGLRLPPERIWLTAE